MHSVTGAGPGRPVAEPTTAAEPAGAAEPATASGPAGSASPVEAAEPAEPAGAAEPADHPGPADATKSTRPADPVEAITPAGAADRADRSDQTGLAAPTAGRARLLTRLAAAGIGGSILIMIAASAVRDSWMYPPVAPPAWGPPWDLQSVHVPVAAVTVALWIAVLVGLGGVIAGLTAVRLGARPSVRGLLVAAALAVAVLTVLPPAGSTDAFDYAAYGRILALGHSPYVMTPYHLRLAHNTFARSVPATWQHFVSVYGPLATLEQFVAAKLGGISAARITFWLKLWNSLAFGLVAFVADRMLRHDPARRLRAHLLWTINPLLLWVIVAAGHLDVLAAAAGLLGLLALGEQRGSARPSVGRLVAAGALIGVAADIKANYVLFGLGVAWALRRSPAALVTAAIAALAVLVPSYAWFGMPAVRALSARRDGLSADSFYHVLESQRHLALIAAVLVVAAAVLTLRRLPDGIPGRPAVRAALALSVAWLFFWPYQFPWYDTMIICLLLLYPASRLDWLVLARVAAGTFPNIPGNPGVLLGPFLGTIHTLSVAIFTPLVLLGVAVSLVVLCLTGNWKMCQPGAPPGAGPPGTAPPGTAPADAALTTSATG
jgi:hypothetical protein